MKANRIILCLKDDTKVRQITAKSFHFHGGYLYVEDLQDACVNKSFPIQNIDRFDVFHINVDPVTFEPVISSFNESA